MQIQLPHNEILRYMFFSLRLQEDNTGLMKSIPHSSCQQSQSIAALVADCRSKNKLSAGEKRERQKDLIKV